MDKDRRRPFSCWGDRARNQLDTRSGLDCTEEERHRCLALTLEDAVDRPSAVLDESGRGERGAVTADADKGPRQPHLGCLCEIDNLRNVGEVVAGKSDDIRPPTVK